MKLTTAIAATACVAAIAYFAGQRSHRQPEQPAGSVEIEGPASRSAALPLRGPRDGSSAVRALGKYASATREYSAENAVRLSTEQRLELLTNGAWAGNHGNQEAMLCGLISVLTRDEIQQAAEILGSIQDQGNSQAPDVWKSLWLQWGRLDPEGCLKFFGPDAVSKTPGDARNVMAGWLETNADAALAWAWSPGKSPLESAAAALAISRSVNGDLEELQSAILKLPAGEETSRVCLEDYFDLATLSGNGRTAADVYDAIRPELRPSAWTVTAKRMGYGDLSEAKQWVASHANDPGRNYGGISDMLHALSHQDPAGTVRWAAQLPYSSASDQMHPAVYPLIRWQERDPAAADQWIKSQPADATWIVRIQRPSP